MEKPQQMKCTYADATQPRMPTYRRTAVPIAHKRHVNRHTRNENLIQNIENDLNFVPGADGGFNRPALVQRFVLFLHCDRHSEFNYTNTDWT